MKTAPAPCSLFRHAYGGLYRFIAEAKHTRDKSALMVYQHLWPFKPGVWARPADEWTEARFTPITEAELLTAMKGDREAAQQQVTATKLARKGS